MGWKTPKTVPSPWDFVNLLKEDRVTAIGNMHRKIGKDHACGSGDILSDRHTDVLITILYFATASVGEVNIHNHKLYEQQPHK